MAVQLHDVLNTLLGLGVTSGNANRSIGGTHRTNGGDLVVVDKRVHKSMSVY